MTRRLYYGDPVNWAHPLNRGLAADWTVVPWYRSGLRLIDLGRRYHGALTNGPTWAGPQGRPGGSGALSFSGSSQYTDHGAFPAAAHSYAALAFWGWQANNNQTLSVGFSGSAGSRFQVLFFGQTLYAVAESGGSQSYNTLALTAVDPSGWHHWVLAFDGSQGTADNRAAVYRDGVAQALSHTTGTYPTTYTPTGNFFVGRDQQNGLYTTGLTDAVQLFLDAPVTASRAWALYDQSRRGNPDRWRWLSSRAYSFTAGASGITGSTSATLGAVTCSAAGAVALTGTTAATLGAVTSSATGAVALAGAAGATLGDVQSAGGAALALAAAEAQTLNAVTLAATGAVAITGQAAPTLGAVTAAGAGALSLSATAIAVLQGLGCSAAGTGGGAGQVAGTLAPVTLAAAGTLTGTPHETLPVRRLHARFGPSARKAAAFDRGNRLAAAFDRDTRLAATME